MTPASDIIIDGQRFHVGIAGHESPRVLTWHDHGVEFRAGEGFNKRRRSTIDLCVWHWSGGENEPLTMVRTLRKRKLGIEFAIGSTGVVYQFCDPMRVDTADAGPVNARSVGVEVINYGVRSFSREDDAFRAGGLLIPKRGVGRTRSEHTIHGRRHTVASFYPAQIAAAQALADALSRALPIPPQVPLDDSRNWVIDHALSADALGAFSGHVGHYHVSKRKLDPGPQFMRELWHHLWRFTEHAA